MRSLILIASVTLAGGLAAQSLTEYAAATTGSSTGAVAGRKLSEGLDKVLSKVAGQTAAAAQTAPNARQGKDVGPTATTATALPGRSRPRRAATPREVAVRFSGPVLPPAPVEPAPQPMPVPFVPSQEDVTAIAPGTSRAEVITRLGTPASKVLMAEEGKLVETYHYRTKGGGFGRVRLVDGTVSAVN